MSTRRGPNTREGRVPREEEGGRDMPKGKARLIDKVVMIERREREEGLGQRSLVATGHWVSN